MRGIIAYTGIMTLLLALLIASSCKQASKQVNDKEAHQIETSRKKSDENVSESQRTSAQFENPKTERVYEQYIQLKMALIHSDPKAAQSASKILSEVAEQEEIKMSSQAILESDGIKMQRQLFDNLTVQMEELLKDALTAGEIYKHYCPMAFNNKGGFWLSSEKEVQNPYYGKQMLKCGSVVDIIN